MKQFAKLVLAVTTVLAVTASPLYAMTEDTFGPQEMELYGPSELAMTAFYDEAFGPAQQESVVAQLDEVYGPQEMAMDTGSSAPLSDDGEQFATAMSDNELDNYRGAFAPVSMANSMNATLQGNSAVNSVSGSNNIGSGALNNVSGLTSVIQNSGNNVIIQSSFQVNVNFE